MIWLRRKKSKPEYPPGNRRSFCSKREKEVSKLFSGSNVSLICDECLEVAEEIFRDREEHPFHSSPFGFQCSFCLKSDEEVKYLVAGPAVYICDNCVDHFRKNIN